MRRFLRLLMLLASGLLMAAFPGSVYAARTLRDRQRVNEAQAKKAEQTSAGDELP